MQKVKSKCWKRVRNGVLIVLGSIVVIYVGTVFYYRLSMIKDIRVENGKIIYKEPFITREKHVRKEVELKHIDQVKEVHDVKFKFNGENMEGISKIVEQYQRYYFPLDEFLEATKIKYSKQQNIYDIKGVRIDLINKNFLKGERLNRLSGDLIEVDGLTYISLNDLEHILSLGDSWNHEEKVISLFNKEEVASNVDRNTLSGKAAMIRLEDVRPGEEYLTNQGIQSAKATADYLSENGIVFNVAWISRFKDPAKQIDNDLMRDESIANVQFVNMLDHFVYRGGAIGLHGYTHQGGGYKSAVGSDLSTEFNASEEETRALVEAAFETAKYLKIPISFFESGHYHATKKQQSIIEEYIEACYEPYKIYWNFQPVVSKRNDSTIYVPTPLGYSTKEDGSDIVENIKKLGEIDNILTSFFIHPTKEMNYFKFTEAENGSFITEHLENSPTQNIVNALKESGHVTITINDLK